MPEPKNTPLLICLICKKQIKVDDTRRMLAFEKPYVNIFVHKSCYETIKDNYNIKILDYAKDIIQYAKKGIYFT